MVSMSWRYHALTWLSTRMSSVSIHTFLERPRESTTKCRWQPTPTWLDFNPHSKPYFLGHWCQYNGCKCYGSSSHPLCRSHGIENVRYASPCFSAKSDINYLCHLSVDICLNGQIYLYGHKYIHHDKDYIVLRTKPHRRVCWCGAQRMSNVSAARGNTLHPIMLTRAPSQYKDRLIYVWRFPC